MKGPRPIKRRGHLSTSPFSPFHARSKTVALCMILQATLHFMNKIAVLLYEKMKGCDWQLRLHSINGEVNAKIVHVKTAKKSSACLGQYDAIERRIRQLHKESKYCLTRTLSEGNVEVERARLLTLKEDTAKDARRHQISVTEVGDYNLILGGLNEFQELLKARKTLE